MVHPPRPTCMDPLVAITMINFKNLNTVKDKIIQVVLNFKKNIATLYDLRSIHTKRTWEQKRKRSTNNPKRSKNKRQTSKKFFAFARCERTFKARSHCAFFPIATAIPAIATNGLQRTQWKCSHYATATTSPTPMQPIVSKNKSLSQIVQCERALSL